MDIDVLAAELTNDPLGRGYSGMSDEEAAADLNTVYRTRVRATIEAWEYFEAIVRSEWDALNETQQTNIRDLLTMGTVASEDGTKAVALTVSVFGAGSDTVAALNAVRTDDISRGTELGIGHVRVGHVHEARAS